MKCILFFDETSDCDVSVLSLKHNFLKAFYMRTLFKNLLLHFWLLAYLSVAQTTFGQFALCFEEDGRITIEAGKCVCHADFTVASLVLKDDIATDHCGPCKDITPTIDISRLASQVRLLYTSLPVVSTHPMAQDKNFCSSSEITFQSILHHTLLIHPSIRTAVLLI